MTIEEAFEAACKRLRFNIKETEKVLRKAPESNKPLILGSGGFALIQANVMHGIVLEETFAAIQAAGNPIEAIRARLMAHLDSLHEQIEAQRKLHIN